MAIRWDPLLVRQLAKELHAALAGIRVRALRLDGSARRLTLLLREATLEWSLHPSRGSPLLLPAAEPDPGDLPLRARIRGVRGEPDERVIVFDLLADRGGAPRELVVELLGNQCNALVVERPSATVRHVLVRRGPPRPVRVGARYEPPPSRPREGVDSPIPLARWLELLERVPPPQRARALVAAVAWTSPLNARALVDADPDPERALVVGHALWASLVFGGVEPEPVLRAEPTGPQPYPWPLPGAEGARVPSLLEGFRLAALGAAGAAEPSAPIPPTLLDDLEAEWHAHLRRASRLREELEALEDERALRSRADLILARLGGIPSGVSKVVVEGFDGVAMTLSLDPARSPRENAEFLYERAARTERARRRLPALLREAEARGAALERLLEGARSGRVSADEVRAAVPSRAGAERAPEPKALPYRVFRSSGGLEIRVGRGERFNDELTFRHAAPGDVWLHARHAAGAHVVLRWGKAGNPPARDLEEAAALAALHSRARTSRVVPVDWTLRKYVRKPRRAPPGTVVLERAHTLMAAPDATLLETLAVEP